MDVPSAWGDHGGLVCAGISSSTYDYMRSTAGCLTPSDSITSVFHCLEARNNRRYVLISISLAVSLAVAARSSVGVAAGGG